MGLLIYAHLGTIIEYLLIKMLKISILLCGLTFFKSNIHNGRLGWTD